MRQTTKTEQKTPKARRALTMAIFNRHSQGDQRLSRSRRKRAVLLVVLTALLAPVIGALVWAPARADEDSKGYSFYGVSSNVTAYFSNANSPDNPGHQMGDGWRGDSGVTGSPGEAGALLGYIDPDFSVSVDWLTSKLSGSSDSIGYDTLVSRDGSGDANTDYEGMLSYAHFGAALDDLGLDSVSSGMGMGLVRFFAGGTIFLLYLLNSGIGVLFSAVIDILQTINPFRWFESAVKAVSPGFAGAVSGSNPVSAAGPLGGLAKFIRSWYVPLHQLAWTAMVPIFLAVLMSGLLLVKNMNRGSAIKKFLLRLMFIGLGLPLIGSMYTGVLNSMSDATDGGSGGATKVVLSTYTDFESWAMKNRLAVPAGATIGWDVDDQQATTAATTNVRATALAINQLAHPGIFGEPGGASSSLDDLGSVTTPGSSNAESETKGEITTTLGILGRYISGDSLEASSFETQAKGAITRSGVDEDKKKSWFEDYSDSEDMDGKKPNSNPVIAIRGTGLTSNNQGATSGSEVFSSGTTAACAYDVSTSAGKPMRCNLSPLAMYNYLNTEFGPNSMKLYSSSKATSGFTRATHNSVNQAGTGVMGVIYWVNAVVSLLALVVLGLSYALGLLMGSLKRTLQAVSAIPFATLGAIAGIAKVIVYSAGMIIEVLMTLFVYQFVVQLVVALPEVLTTPLSAALKNGNLLPAAGLMVVLPVIGIIALVMFIGMALRLRKTMVTTVEEAVTKLVEKFTETSGMGPAPKGGLLGAAAGGLGSGAGMAGGAALMNKFGGGSGPAKAVTAGGDSAQSDSNTAKVGTSKGTNLGGNKGIGSGGSPALGPGSGPQGPGGGGAGGGGNLPAGNAGSGSTSSGRSASGSGVGAGSEPGPGSGSGARRGGAGGSSSAAGGKSPKDVAADVARRGGLSKIGTGSRGSGGSSGSSGLQSTALAAVKGAQIGAKAGGPAGAAVGAAGGVAANKLMSKKGGSPQTKTSKPDKPRPAAAPAEQTNASPKEVSAAKPAAPRPTQPVLPKIRPKD